MNARIAVLTFVALAACPPAGTPVLSLSAKPSRIDNVSQTAKILVTAQDELGNPGSGSVKVTSAAGSLTDGQTVTLDSMGSGEADFQCPVATDVKCTGHVRVVGEWTTAKSGTITGEASVTVGAPTDGGTGGGSGAGGGSAVGGGTAVGGGSAVGGGAAAGGGAGTGGGTASGGGTGTGGGSGAGGGMMGTLFHGDAGEVFLLGKLVESMSGTRADLLAHLDAPDNPILAFPSVGYDPTKVQLSPDGTLVYLDLVRSGLFALVTDPWAHAGNGSAYPSDAGANDVEIPTPACTGNVSAFWVRPDTGGVVYTCSAPMMYYEGSTDQSALDGKTLLALGSSNTALVLSSGTPQTVDVSGTAHNISGLLASQLPSSVYRAVRASGTFFRVPVAEGSGNLAPCDQYTIDSSTGAATQTGTYANLPGTVASDFGCAGSVARIDSAGNLVSLAQEGSAQVVYLRTTTGTATRLYTEANGTVPNLSLYPPTNLFTWWGTGASLVSGP